MVNKDCEYVLTYLKVNKSLIAYCFLDLIVYVEEEEDYASIESMLLAEQYHYDL